MSGADRGTRAGAVGDSPEGRSLDRRILRLAIPNLTASLSVPLLGVADTAMIGHLPEVAYLGAVAAASAIFDLVFWGIGFLRMGTTSLVSQFYGAGRPDRCFHALLRSLMLAVGFGLAILVCRELVAEWGFRLIGGSPDVREWGTRYFEIRVYTVPLMLMVLGLNGFFLGTANAVAPMCVALVANLVNVVADYALIFGGFGFPAMGVVGAAWATVVASVIAICTALGFLLRQYRSYFNRNLSGLMTWSRWRLMFRTNVHLFVRTLCLLSAQFAMLGMVSRLGEVPLAANAIVWQLWTVVSFAVDGFAYAAETLVGNSLGRNYFDDSRQVANRILLWGIGIGCLFLVGFVFLLRPVASLMTEHVSVIETVAALTLLVALPQPLNAAVYVFDGIFIGANDTAYLLGAMLASALCFFVPAALLFVAWLELGIVGAWLAYNCLMVGRFATLYPRLRGDCWQRSIAMH